MTVVANVPSPQIANPSENGDARSKETKPVANGAPKKPRPSRPNFNQIHAKPLPLEVYPLPAFIPHNPISIIRIAISLISHSIWRPRSHVVIHQAYFSPETQSVHVTDPKSIRALWEQGFWGKGSLSRSEPQWLAAERRRLGVQESKTSTEVTLSRREERKQFKLERAKAQREAIEQQLRREGKLDADGSLHQLVEDEKVIESPKGTTYTPGAGDVVTVIGENVGTELENALASHTTSTTPHQLPNEIIDLEHLQLTPEEAFFLTYALGTLSIVKVSDAYPDFEPPPSPFPAWFLIRLYSLHAAFPYSDSQAAHLFGAYRLKSRPLGVYPASSCIPQIEPDNSFILNYVVYHHFRSLGWIVRPGVKFAVDYLLYLRGPVFSHAEYAVIIIPSYSHPYWSEASEHTTGTSERRKTAQRDWWWLHRVNRVQTQVMKTLVLVYVEVPPPWDEEYAVDGWMVDVGATLKKYSVREFVVKRWSPSRNRD